MSIRARAPTGIAASCVSRIPARFASCLVSELGASRTGAGFQRITTGRRAVSKTCTAQSAYVRKWVPDRRTATTNLASSSARGHGALRRTGSGRAVRRTPYPDALLRSVNLSPVSAMDYVRTRVANLCRKYRLAEQRDAAADAHTASERPGSHASQQSPNHHATPIQSRRSRQLELGGRPRQRPRLP